MKREEMIRLLVLDRLEHREDMRRYMHLHHVLENGFRGFRNLSDAELLAEIRALGLDRPIDEEDGDLADDDYAFDSSSLAGFGLAIETLADRLR
ncbi:MAG: hypothetical protein CVU34_04810 [Betaproteobacteria bacterium HGW-Betaproteobacteria-7]|jgi:hypothetical protein|nr:MAG: hypothetical protein CVU34_04810 [Betaproteobacteria bacterium HGW-Betaproteobacteria-7]